MEKRRRVLLALLAIAVIAGFAFVVWRTSEPVYQGRRLSWWIEDLTYANDNAEFQRAAEAMRQIGSNAVPTLVRIMRARESSLQSKFRHLLAKQSIVHFRFRTVNERRQEAIAAFEVLGPDARSAVPALVDLLGDRDEMVRYQAAEALANIGAAASNAVPVLINCSRDPDYLVRSKAVEALGEIGQDEKEAMPILVKALSDPQESMRITAEVALAHFGAQARMTVPQLIKFAKDEGRHSRLSAISALMVIDQDEPSVYVPLLIGCLADSNWTVRCGAAAMLGDMGSDAASAVEPLTKMLSNENIYVRDAATNALKKLNQK